MLIKKIIYWIIINTFSTKDIIEKNKCLMVICRLCAPFFSQTNAVKIIFGKLFILLVRYIMCNFGSLFYYYTNLLHGFYSILCHKIMD